MPVKFCCSWFKQCCFVRLRAACAAQSYCDNFTLQVLKEKVHRGFLRVFVFLTDLYRCVFLFAGLYRFGLWFSEKNLHRDCK